MRVKKFAGKPYGVELTAAERKAMNMEIKRQILEKDEKYTEDLDVMVLYAIHVHTGWKKLKLHRFWKDFIAAHRALREHYEMYEPGDDAWLARRKLKEIGVDVHQWYMEEENGQD